MNIGELVMVRLEITGKEGQIVPAIVLRHIQETNPPTFEVLAKGESWIVTAKDIEVSHA